MQHSILRGRVAFTGLAKEAQITMITKLVPSNDE